jgi:hypothetical protein
LIDNSHFVAATIEGGLIAVAPCDIESPMLYSEHLTGDGQEMFRHASKLNWEGIVAKRADAPYRSKRNESWVKVKTVQKGTFPVIGFINDPSGVAALYLEKQEGTGLVYMGKVGMGWNRTVSSRIRKQLDTVVSPKSKLTKQVRKPKATWVEPTFFADIEYRDITSEGDCFGPVRSKDYRVAIIPNCPICFGLGWVCENHPTKIWDERGCECGAATPCECNHTPEVQQGIEEPDTSQVISPDERP